MEQKNPVHGKLKKNRILHNYQRYYYISYYGQLTNLGRLRMTGLGQRLREVYIDK